MNKLLFLLVPSFLWGYTEIKMTQCPKKAHEVVMFIDSCPTHKADYVTKHPTAKICSNTEHAEKVIETYKSEGGAKKVWLWSYFYDDLSDGGRAYFTIKAIEAATYCGVKFINYSGGGYSVLPEEKDAVDLFLKMGGTLVAAAGNDHKNIDRQPFYPASYKGVIAVGGTPCKQGVSSNYGSKVVWDLGCDPSKTLHGTSLATPRVMAKLEKKIKKEVERRKNAENRRKAEWQRRCRQLKASFCDRAN